MKNLVCLFVLSSLCVSGISFAKASKKEVKGQLNLNTASVEQLDQLPSISPKKAQDIFDYRKEHPYKSVDDLDNVKGFSPKSIDKIRSYVSVQGENTLSVEGGKSSKKSKKESASSKKKKKSSEA
ncbi:MAG: ComEA family DNA-binding protein [Deltaproteobacteria bacterium]|nr:ComEA family DNA-binding protein [Deltaproteobacteria bacterium]